jgi:hypothetical protein
MLQKRVIADHAIAQQMFLNNAFQHLRRDGMVPDPVRINQENRSLLTDLQTIGFSPKDGPRSLRRGPIQPQFLQTAFQVVPGFQTEGAIAALGLSLICAQKQMALNRSQS